MTARATASSATAPSRLPRLLSIVRHRASSSNDRETRPAPGDGLAAGMIIAIGYAQFAGIIGPTVLALVVTICVQPARVLPNGSDWAGPSPRPWWSSSCSPCWWRSARRWWWRSGSSRRSSPSTPTRSRPSNATSPMSCTASASVGPRCRRCWRTSTPPRWCDRVRPGQRGLRTRVRVAPGRRTGGVHGHRRGYARLIGDGSARSGLTSSPPSSSSASRSTATCCVTARLLGAIVSTLDTVALLILAIPGALLWGLLAFITGFIPNIGYWIGIAPPSCSRTSARDGGRPSPSSSSTRSSTA